MLKLKAMEETKLKSTTGIRGFQHQNNTAKLMLRQNYVNQYRNYYDGYFNLHQWKAHMYSRLTRVNQSWNNEYSSFGEFRDNPRKVTFDDNVMFHDYDSELENEDKGPDSYTVRGSGTNIQNNVNGSENLAFQNSDTVAQAAGSENTYNQNETDTSMTANVPCKPQTPIYVPINLERPEGFLYFEDVSSPFSPTSEDIRTPKSDSVPNLPHRDLKDVELDLKMCHSDTTMANAPNFQSIRRRSPKNRAGTPRYLSKSCHHTSLPQVQEKDHEGKGDEENLDESTEMKKKVKAEDFDGNFPIPIHPSVTKIKLLTALENDAKFQNTTLDQLLETNPLSQDLVSPIIVSLDSGTSSTNHVQDPIDDNQLNSLPTVTCPPEKERRKVKRSSKSRSNERNNRKDKSQKEEAKLKSEKPVKKEKPITTYIRRENARIQGQRLFNEIKQQISKYNVDKHILSTIFNKQFVALLLTEETMRKCQVSGRVNTSSVANLQNPKMRSNKIIKLGSKWASKPVENVRTATIKNSELVAAKKSNEIKLHTISTSVFPSKLKKEKVEDKISKLEKEKVEDKISKPGFVNTNVETEKIKLPPIASTSSPTTRKKKFSKKEAKKSQKRSKTPISKKTEKQSTNEVAEEINIKVLSPKNGKPTTPRKEDEEESKGDEIKSGRSARSKIPKPVSKSVKDKIGMAQRSSVNQEKLSIPKSASIETVDLLKKSRIDRPQTCIPTNPLDYSSFDRWLLESKKFENNRTCPNGDMSTWKMSHGDERELKILRSIKRNPQMLDAYTTYRFGGPLTPTELDRIMKRF